MCGELTITHSCPKHVLRPRLFFLRFGLSCVKDNFPHLYRKLLLPNHHSSFLSFSLFQLPYAISVEVSNPLVLNSSFNISKVGDIPIDGIQTWALTLHCGPYNAEIDLTLHVNVSVPRRNTTILEFRRKKICLKGESNYLGPEEVSVTVGSSSGSQVFYAAIGCTCAFIAAIFVLVIAYYVRNKKARRHREPLQ